MEGIDEYRIIDSEQAYSDLMIGGIDDWISCQSSSIEVMSKH